MKNLHLQLFTLFFLKEHTLKSVFTSLMSKVVRYYSQFKGKSKDQEYWNKCAIGGKTGRDMG